MIAEHDDRRQEPADHRDHDEVADRDRVLEPEADRHDLGEHGEHQRDRQRQRDRDGDVLADDRVHAPRQPEGAGVDRGAEAAAQCTEHVAAHADGGGNEDEESGKLFERAGDRAERQPGEEVTARADEERDEARSDADPVRAQQRAQARDGGPPRTQHWSTSYSEARSSHVSVAVPGRHRCPACRRRGRGRR